MVRGINDHLILGVGFPNALATKQLSLEKAKEAIAAGKEKDTNIRKLKNLVNIADPDIKVSSQEEKERDRGLWNEIVARTLTRESFMPVDWKILCPACVTRTPARLSLCLNCMGTLLSCGVRNTISTTTPCH